MSNASIILFACCSNNLFKLANILHTGTYQIVYEKQALCDKYAPHNGESCHDADYDLHHAKDYWMDQSQSIDHARQPALVMQHQV